MTDLPPPLPPQPGPPAAVSAVLTETQVKVNSGFRGATISVYGAVFDPQGRPADVVVVIAGPEQPLRIARKSQVAGLWLNSRPVVFRGAPGFYRVASTRPLGDIARFGDLRRLGLGLDHLAVTDWVRSNVQGAQRLILAGDSAGAWLAATVAARVNAQNPGAVIAQALIYPLVDMDDEAWAETLFRDGRIVGRLAVAYIRAALTCDAPTLIDAIGPHTPSTLLLVGGPLDPVRPDVERYFEALAANGVKTIIRRHNALPHGFGNLTHVSAEARDAIADAGQRLKALVA